ncbi:MAG: hypothetical protein SVU32_01030 [Candidatus Nanohaloarchaea archaeon]|nr:hypothetical protein [Candidatus Nanohaloarchaea archaeon]
MESEDIYANTQYRRVSILLLLYLWLLLGFVWSNPDINIYFPGSLMILPWTTGIKALFSAAATVVVLAWLLWPRFDPDGFLLAEASEDDRIAVSVAAKGKHLAGLFGAFLGVMIATIILETFPGMFGAGTFTNAARLLFALVLTIAGLLGSHYFVATYAEYVEE